MIPEEFIARVAAATDIVELVGATVPLARIRGVFRSQCPFHPGNTRTFRVDPRRQMFWCSGCGAKGGIFRFLMDQERIDFPRAVKRLAERSGIAILEDPIPSG